MKLINVGYGNMISSDRLVAIVSPESAPVKRIPEIKRYAAVNSSSLVPVGSLLPVTAGVADVARLFMRRELRINVEQVDVDV